VEEEVLLKIVRCCVRNVTGLSLGNERYPFHNSTRKTKNTSIEAGHGATIEMQGGAQIKKDEDGSISFFT
jgi:hypothetical protein